MKTIKEYLKEEKAGTYVGGRFSIQTKMDIDYFIKSMNIPNPIDMDKLHTTIIFSRKHLPLFKAKGKLDEFIIGKYKSIEVWPTRDGKNALVMLFDCPKLVARHNEIMGTHSATYDFPEYKTHLTLSYDLGEDDSVLGEYTGVIEIVEEYQSPLDPEWS